MKSSLYKKVLGDGDINCHNETNAHTNPLHTLVPIVSLTAKR